MIHRHIRPLALLAAMAVATLGCSMLPGATTPPTPAPVASEAGGGGTGSCPTAQPAALQAGETRTVTIATDLGDMKLKIQGDLSPIAAGNFVALAECGFYDDVIFHRVIPGFVIQGGDGQFGKKAALERSRVGTGGPGYKFEDEPVQGEYARGSLAMANSGPNTNGSQFFICTDDLSGRLPKNYTLFGQVTKGLDVVDRFVSAPRDARDLPNEPVAMTSVTIHPEQG
jgi:cyclophilin family peptidyl-prolyl cis-trans isomerase